MPSGGTESALRVTDIVALLRPEKPRKLPETLTAADMLSNLERMQGFLDRGANIEERSTGCARHLGAGGARGQVGAGRWLSARGALLDPPEALISPIQAALGQADCEAAAALLDAGLPVERAAWGVSAAASLGRLDALRWLVGRGVELDRSYPRMGVLRAHALAAAEKSGKADVARYLRGEADPGPAPEAPPAKPPRRVNPPPAPAAQRPRLLREALDLVRSGGAAAAHWNATGPSKSLSESLISHAAAHGAAEIVVALLDAGAEPDFALEGTSPPLTRAAAEAHVDVMRILLERGASPNGLDGKNRLPLAAAAMSGEPEAVKMLLDAGANAKAKPAGGPSLVEHARGPFAAEIRAMLEQAAASKGSAKKKHA